MYVEANGFIEKPEFAWWVPFTLKKKDKIIAKVKSRMKKVTHKYGLKVLRNFTHTDELDNRNNNTLWEDAIKKEMTNVRSAFDVNKKNTKIYPGHSYLDCHLIF